MGLQGEQQIIGRPFLQGKDIFREYTQGGQSSLWFLLPRQKREGTKKRMQNIELFWRVIEEKEQMDDTLQQERNISPLNKYIVKYELVK